MEEWIQRIAVYIVLVTVLRSLISRPQYQQYFRFVSGLILILLLITPVVGVLGDDSRLYEILNRHLCQWDLDEIRSSLQLAEGQRKELIREEYQRSISIQIKDLAEQRGLSVREVRVTLGAEDEVTALEIYVESLKQSPSKADLREFRKLLQQYYQLGEESVVIWI